MLSEHLGLDRPSDHPFLARMLSPNASTLLNSFDPSALSPHNPLTKKKLQSSLVKVLTQHLKDRVRSISAAPIPPSKPISTAEKHRRTLALLNTSRSQFSRVIRCDLSIEDNWVPRLPFIFATRWYLGLPVWEGNF